MSLYDYRISRTLMIGDPPFSSFIMAAMRKADSKNIEKLKFVFPDIWKELQARYNAPAGVLLSDEEYSQGT